MKRHLVGYKKKKNNHHQCQKCGLDLNNYTTLFEHTHTNHPEQLGGRIIIHPTSTENYIEDSVNVLNIVPTHEDKYDLLTFFASIRHEIDQHLTERCEKIQQIKCYLNLQVEFIRETNDGETDKSELYFKRKTYTLLSKEDLTDNDVNEFFQNQLASFEEYIARGSGCTLSQAIRMEVHTAQYRPIGGSNSI